MMTKTELATIEARCAAATKGPWVWDGTDGSMAVLVPSEDWMDEILACLPCPACHEVKRNCSLPRKPDADFIAHSREDIPNLLAEVKRLTAEAQ